MKDEDVVLGMAREVARLPEAEQIPAIRRLALERLGRTMNAYAPENVPDRPYAEFARDPGPGAGASTREARALASGYSLERGQAFYAWQTELIPAPVVPQSGPLNESGFFYDVFQAGAGEVRRQWRDFELQLDYEMRRFFQLNYGYSP